MVPPPPPLASPRYRAASPSHPSSHLDRTQPTPLFAAPPLPMRGRSLRQLRRTTAATADCHRCRRRLRPRHPRCRCQPHRQRRCHYLPTLQLSTCRPKLHHHLLFNGAYSSRRRLRNPTSPGCQHRCVGLPPSSTHLSLQLDSLQPGVCPCSSLQHADICAAGLQPALILSASQPTPPQPCSRLDSIAIPRALPQAGQLITAEVQAQSRCHRGQRAPAASVRLRVLLPLFTQLLQGASSSGLTGSPTRLGIRLLPIWSFTISPYAFAVVIGLQSHICACLVAADGINYPIAASTSDW